MKLHSFLILLVATIGLVKADDEDNVPTASPAPSDTMSPSVADDFFNLDDFLGIFDDAFFQFDDALFSTEPVPITDLRDPNVLRLARYAARSVLRNQPRLYTWSIRLLRSNRRRYSVRVIRGTTLLESDGSVTYELDIRILSRGSCFGGFSASLNESSSNRVSVVEYGQALGCRSKLGLFGLFG